MKDDIKHSQRLLIGHGALILLFGFAVGFAFLFFLIGEIKLWPIPGSINYQLPGTYDAWRMAHMEGITNGLLLWIVAAVLPSIASFAGKTYRLAQWLALASWTIVVASLFDPLFVQAKGLAFTYGENLPNDIAFFLFYIGIVIAVAVVSFIAVKSFTGSEG